MKRRSHVNTSGRNNVATPGVITTGRRVGGMAQIANRPHPADSPDASELHSEPISNATADGPRDGGKISGRFIKD